MRVFFWLLVKRKVEEFLMWPFVLAGKRQAARHPLVKEYDLFVFVPDYALGGAEKVHAEIIACFPDKAVMVLFTRKSPNDKMLHLFRLNHVNIMDISRHTDNKWLYWQNFVWRGRCAAYINRQKNKPVVFIGQCNFGYKLLPHLRKAVKNAELIHVSEKKFSWVTFPFVGLIQKRIMVADQIIQEIIGYYREIGIPQRLDERIVKIFYKTDLPPVLPDRKYNDPVKVYYAGRGGYQKRIHLLVAVARKAWQMQLPLEFHFAGDIAAELPEDILTYCKYHGKIQGGADMTAFHQQMDVLLMTSSFEGFPLLIMEAMSNAVVPVATAVSGIPEHIRDAENGFLISATTENAIVMEAIDHLKYLSSHKDELERMAAAARHYAEQHFSGERFCKAYSEVLLG